MPIHPMQIVRKENDLDQMADIIRKKDQEAEMLQRKRELLSGLELHPIRVIPTSGVVDEMEVLRAHLTELEQELQNAR